METSETNPPAKAAEKTLTVQNKMGIHARPAAMIVRITNRFKADVYFEKDEEQVNGKSIMGLMMLAAGRGSKIKVSATGADADELIKDLEELFERRFDEG
jgi:phosphocarrier protein HPr